MKKTLTLSLILCIVLGLIACSGKTDDPAANSTTAATEPSAPATTPTTPVPPISRREISDDLLLQYWDTEEILAQFGTPWDTDVSLDVPVHYENELLLHPAGPYYLGRDASAHYVGNTNANTPGSVFMPFHPSALRLRTDGTFYAMYDTDTGYRLYIFFVRKETSFHKIQFSGYPVVINKNKMLSRNDFKNIKTGDPIEKVEAIDEIVTLHKKLFLDVLGLTPSTFKISSERGSSVATIHYLKDGLLKITYSMTEDRQVLVGNLFFYEDYIVPTYDGELTSHKIKDIDLPVT